MQFITLVASLVAAASAVVAAPAAPEARGSSYLSGTNSGDGTFYATGLGACGITNNDSQYIVAVSQDLFDSYPGAGANPNANPVCNKKIKASYGGKSVTVTVTDRCTGCSLTSLDFSPAAFDKLASESVGRIHNVEWTWA
ncbi:hypothetical protein PENSPDRAFT_567867 [Peniophora sp. CONT]|nr:hypothetical protein PENSPDRAFT_567867 [Peniophora sp. CONT]